MSGKQSGKSVKRGALQMESPVCGRISRILRALEWLHIHSTERKQREQKENTPDKAGRLSLVCVLRILTFSQEQWETDYSWIGRRQ